MRGSIVLINQTDGKYRGGPDKNDYALNRRVYVAEGGKVQLMFGESCVGNFSPGLSRGNFLNNSAPCHDPLLFSTQSRLLPVGPAAFEVSIFQGSALR